MKPDQRTIQALRTMRPRIEADTKVADDGLLVFPGSNVLALLDALDAAEQQLEVARSDVEHALTRQAATLRKAGRLRQQLKAWRDPRIVTRAVRAADAAFERVGGSSRHWTLECFLPRMEAEVEDWLQNLGLDCEVGGCGACGAPCQQEAPPPSYQDPLLAATHQRATWVEKHHPVGSLEWQTAGDCIALLRVAVEREQERDEWKRRATKAEAFEHDCISSEVVYLVQDKASLTEQRDGLVVLLAEAQEERDRAVACCLTSADDCRTSSGLVGCEACERENTCDLAAICKAAAERACATRAKPPHTQAQEEPIRHDGDDPRCTCGACPPGRDDMFWRQNEEVACERRHRGGR